MVGRDQSLDFVTSHRTDGARQIQLALQSLDGAFDTTANRTCSCCGQPQGEGLALLRARGVDDIRVRGGRATTMGALRQPIAE